MQLRIAMKIISWVCLSVTAMSAWSGTSEPPVPVWRQQLTVAIDEYMLSWVASAKLTEETQISYQVNSVDPRLKLHACEQTPYIAPNSKMRGGKITLKAECRLPHPWKIYLTVEVDRMHPVVFTTASIARNRMLTVADLELKLTNIDKLNFGYFTSVDEAEGMIARRLLTPGKALSPNQVLPPKLINKGDSVLIEASNPQINVKMPGLAMSDGRRGQQISVKNRQSNRIVRAEVVANGIVRVPL